MQGARILVVDDDADVRGLVRELLERAGATVREATDGRQALRILFDARPDVIVLDVTMPGLDGWETLERIRDLTEVPVLMLTARDTEMEKVRGLQGRRGRLRHQAVRPPGAARAGERAAARAGVGAARDAGRETYIDGELNVDVAAADVRVGGRQVQLTPLEFRLLLTFLRNPGQVLSREQLLELVWGDAEAVNPSQVKVTVSYLRHKLSDAGVSPIATVRGFGYRWESLE